MKSANIRAAAPYILLLAGAAALYIVAAQITYPARPGQLGPDFWPKLALGLIGVVCLIEITKALVSGHETQAVGIADVIEVGEEEEDEAPRQPMLLAAGIGLTVAYGALVGVLGFTLATFLYLVAFMYVGGFRSHLAIWLSSLVGTVALALLFLKVVYVSLPRGVPPLDRLTDLLTGSF